MIDRKDLEIAVEELKNSPPTYQTCSKLADLYIILDHLGQNYVEAKNVPRQATESEFMAAVGGKNMDAVMAIMDELMEATQVLNPRLYENVLIRINEL